MKRFKYLIYGIGGAFALCMAAASCSDEAEELTEVSYDRLFSPVDLEVRVRQQVNAAVSWNEVDKAESYTLELYLGENSETGVLTQTENTTATSFLFSKLEGAETYAVRVKAVGTAVPESKWTEKSFKTDAEQLFYEVDPSMVEARQVTLTWPAGENVQTLTVEPGEITHTLTAEEIAAGQATITGLTPETAYTATLWKGTKSRGSVTFTTSVDLDGATPLYADATAEEIVQLFQGLNEGDKVCLLPAADGTATFAAAEVTLPVSCSVMALQSKPVKVGWQFKVDGSSIQDIVIKDLNFESDKTASLLTVLNVASGANITISNCTISAYTNIVREDDASSTVSAGELVIDNCIVTNISARAVDFQKKKINFASFSLKNSTIYNACNSSDLIRFDYVAGRVGATYAVENNTLYDVKASSKGIVYIRSNKNGDQAFTCRISHNIFAYSSEATDVYFSEDAKTDNVIFDGNYYFNATSLTTTDSTGKVFDTTGTTADPQFKDAANGDFTVGNEDILYNKIGDPRWLK